MPPPMPPPMSRTMSPPMSPPMSRPRPPPMLRPRPMPRPMPPPMPQLIPSPIVQIGTQPAPSTRVPSVHQAHSPHPQNSPSSVRKKPAPIASGADKRWLSDGTSGATHEELDCDPDLANWDDETTSVDFSPPGFDR
ncbi:MAG: hypothetical protein FWD57_16545, partial [Polyangiaceae bacterium]|nr:hypothetical protein [Polyangiaceae bacterium]